MPDLDRRQRLPLTSFEQAASTLDSTLGSTSHSHGGGLMGQGPRSITETTVLVPASCLLQVGATQSEKQPSQAPTELACACREPAATLAAAQWREMAT